MEQTNCPLAKTKSYLETEKDRLYQEIGHYPTPITGCDQQFNYLLERQRNILRLLAHLNEGEINHLLTKKPQHIFEALQQVVSNIDAETATQIKFCLAKQDTI